MTRAEKRSRQLPPVLGVLCAIALLALPGSAQAIAGTSTAATSTFPAPASAQPQPGQSTTQLPSTGVGRPVAHDTRSGGSSRLSSAAIVLAVLAALLGLGCLAWAAARFSAFEPRWARSARHALAESGFRASATWAEFSDWVRLGK